MAGQYFEVQTQRRDLRAYCSKSIRCLRSRPVTDPQVAGLQILDIVADEFVHAPPDLAGAIRERNFE